MPRIVKTLFGISLSGQASRASGAKDIFTIANRRFAFCYQDAWKNKIFWMVMSIAFVLPHSAFACSACTGRSDDTVAQGLNAAVLTLLIVLLTVVGAFVSFLVYLIRRAAKHPLSLPNG